MAPSLVTLCVGAGPLDPGPDDAAPPDGPEDEADPDTDPKKLVRIDQSMVKGVSTSQTRDMRPPSCEEIAEVQGSTITVADGAICSSFSDLAMSSVSRFLVGKVVDREKLV